MNKKQVLRTVIFFVAVFVILVLLCDLFEYQTSNMSRRYEKYKVLGDDTIDVVMVGTSGVDRYFINSKAYEEYGMTVYPLSTEGEPPWLVKNMLVEACKYQQPKLIVLDIRPFTSTNYSNNITLTDVRCRRVIDMLDFFSLNRLDAINTTQKVMSSLDEDTGRFDPSYFFSFIRYHNMWSDDEFTFDELKTERAGYMGFYIAKSVSIKQKKRKASEYTDAFGELHPLSEQYLYEVLDYIKENNLNVLFIDTPTYVSEEQSAIRNTIEKIVTDAGYNYLSYNSRAMETEYPFVLETDFYNSAHVNYYGAEKFTDYFAAFLNDHYDLPDHRGDKACEPDWKGIYDKVKKRIKTLEESKK